MLRKRSRSFNTSHGSRASRKQIEIVMLHQALGWRVFKFSSFLMTFSWFLYESGMFSRSDLFLAAINLMWIRSETCDFCWFNFCRVFFCENVLNTSQNHVKSVFKICYQNLSRTVSKLCQVFLCPCLKPTHQEPQKSNCVSKPYRSCIYIYVDIYIYIHICMCMYIYIYLSKTHRKPDQKSDTAPSKTIWKISKLCIQ